MKLLESERTSLEHFAPGLDQRLKDVGMQALETVPSPGLTIFREYRAAGLLVPGSFGGMGASALDALRFHIALSSRAPSLGIATTMHHYKVAALVELSKSGCDLSSTMRGIAKNNWLVASGGAEGEPGRNLYAPSMTSRDSDDGKGILVTGTKKPCSLTWSMNLLSMMLRSSPESRYRGELLHVLVDPTHPSVKRESFWTNPILAAAESHAVTLTDTPVDAAHIFTIGSAEDATPFALAAFAWFELLACGTYVGIISAFIEQMLQGGKGSKVCRAELAIQHDSLLTVLEYLALKLDQNALDPELLSRIFRLRYFTERTISQMATQCLDACGGLMFVRTFEVSYLALAANALHFHPPSMSSMTDNIAGQLVGERLVLA